MCKSIETRGNWEILVLSQKLSFVSAASEFWNPPRKNLPMAETGKRALRNSNSHFFRGQRESWGTPFPHKNIKSLLFYDFRHQ
jgi:hypothetical protein